MTEKLKWPDKDPDEILDYTVRWWRRLVDDTIIASIWTVPAGITMTDSSFQPDYTTIWLSGGTTGQTYEIVNEIVTAGGRTMDQTVRVNIIDK